MAKKTLPERFNAAHDEEKPGFLLNLNRHWRKKLLSQLSEEKIADTLAYSDEDDAVACLEILPASRRKAILKLIHDDKREKLKQLLSFAPDTAGRLVDTNFIEIFLTTPIDQIRKKVRNHYEKTGKTPTIIVEDEEGKIAGELPIEQLLLTDMKRKTFHIPIDKLYSLPTVKHTLDQEALISKIASSRSKIIAVVDEKNRILGIVRTHDLLRVLEQEATEDFYRFAGLPPEEHIFDSPLRAVRLRSRWLVLNLATSVLAAVVISFFEKTIAQVVILAAFMPVVAGMGGNAGTQTLAVMVRGIATGEVKLRTAWWVVLKELAAGLLNGVITGAIVAVVAALWQTSPLLGLVLFLAMVTNLLVAGLFGALVPLALRAIRVDPALASSTLITTATDIFGFLAFLSLATWLLI